MLTLIDINKVINRILKTHISTVKIYDKESVEGFRKPTFFTAVMPLSTEHDTVNFTTNKVMVVINYFNGKGKHAEVDNLKMHSKLLEVFGISLKVLDRSITLRNIRSETIEGVLQFKFDLHYKDSMAREATEEIMEDLDISIKEKE